MSKSIVAITYKGGIRKNKYAIRHIKCDVCGHQTKVTGVATSSYIKAALTRGCSCCRSNNRKEVRVPKHTIDGRSRHPLYVHYRAMLDRTNPCTKNPHYIKYYVSRGITVCERWLGSFWAFVEDMGDKPTNKHTLDRLNNDKGYCPENCDWRTMTEQANNKRACRSVK